MTKLEKAIKDVVVVKGGRTMLRCEKALALALYCGVDARKVGAYCNKRKIKIVQCKLGCFK
jgi:hypothetical protein